MYKLIKKTAKRREYRSEITGTIVVTGLIKTDPAGNKWWAFEDLLSIPYMRKKAAQHITDMYSAGMTKSDLASIFKNLKEVLKSGDSEKYEKAYSEILRAEAILSNVMDYEAQSLSLASIYILSDDERIDTFSFGDAAKKLEDWRLQPELQSFFLNYVTDGMNAYMSLYQKASQLASTEM